MTPAPFCRFIGIGIVSFVDWGLYIRICNKVRRSESGGFRHITYFLIGVGGGRFTFKGG